MHSEFARLVGCCGNYPALVALPSDDYGFAFQRWIVQFLHRDKERIHIDVEDGSGESRQLRCDGHERIVAAKSAGAALRGSAEGGCPHRRARPGLSLAPPPACFASASRARKSFRTPAPMRSRKSLC